MPAINYRNIVLQAWTLYRIFEGTACYAGLLLVPAEGFGLWPSLFCPSGKKKKAFNVVWVNFRPIFGA